MQHELWISSYLRWTELRIYWYLKQNWLFVGSDCDRPQQISVPRTFVSIRQLATVQIKVSYKTITYFTHTTTSSCRSWFVIGTGRDIQVHGPIAKSTPKVHVPIHILSQSCRLCEQARGEPLLLRLIDWFVRSFIHLYFVYSTYLTSHSHIDWLSVD